MHMEWSEAAIKNYGFSMVLGQPTIGNDGFSMVGHHWSNDVMVTYYRRSLLHIMTNFDSGLDEMRRTVV